MKKGINPLKLQKIKSVREGNTKNKQKQKIVQAFKLYEMGDLDEDDLEELYDSLTMIINRKQLK